VDLRDDVVDVGGAPPALRPLAGQAPQQHGLRRVQAARPPHARRSRIFLVVREPSIPAGPLSIRVAVSIHAPGTDAGRLRDIVEWGVAHCPVTDAVQRAVPLEVAITA
jgi:hypothetical protein